MPLRIASVLCLAALLGCQTHSSVPAASPVLRASPQLAPSCQVLGGVYRCQWIEPAGAVRTFVL